MNIKYHIPNAITVLNLISGVVAIIFLFNGYVIEAALMVGLATILDFFDGFVAKLLNSKSLIGKELDSLADVVSFGVVPALFLFHLITKSLYLAGYSENYYFIPYLALAVAAFSALRLAKFNLDTRQTTSFLGLPTPANAVFIISFAVIGHFQDSPIEIINQITSNLWVQIGLIPITCFLLISELPMFAIKVSKGVKFKDNSLKYTFLIIAALLVGTLYWTGLTLAMILYVIMSLLFEKRKNF